MSDWFYFFLSVIDRYPRIIGVFSLGIAFSIIFLIGGYYLAVSLDNQSTGIFTQVGSTLAPKVILVSKILAGASFFICTERAISLFIKYKDNI